VTEAGQQDHEQDLRRLAEGLGLVFEKVDEAGSRGNTAGLRSDRLLFSRRLDSRTYFVHDEHFGLHRAGGVFDGPDDELLERAHEVAKRLDVPLEEVDGHTILTEQTRVGEVDLETGALRMEDVEEGKRLVVLRRRLRDLPVWSSNVVLGVRMDRRIGFLQLHWPEIPDQVVDRGGKLAAAVAGEWRAPERAGARVESVEAGILHSPAISLVMDVVAAIRVIYEPEDPAYGRKLTLYVDEEGNDITLPRQFEKMEEEPPPKREERPPQEQIEHARRGFRALLAANPNYFGTTPELDFPVLLPLQLDTFYEEIGCVGYEPQLRRLEAVVYVRQETGYGGDICSPGTREFVRFYLSFDNGATWLDQGMASFAAYDIPGSKPLEYDVTVQIDPPQEFCFTENLPLVRAILSWNNAPPPSDPGFVPVWGEVQEARIQIAPKPFLLLKDFLALTKLELSKDLAAVVDSEQALAVTKPKPSLQELHHAYKDEVEPHRYLLPEIEQVVASPSLTVGPELPLTKLAVELDLDLGAIIGALFETNGDTSYEELHCVGLNTDASALVGVLQVKRSSGYSGSLCTTGSQEYVAFWIDWGAGWTYAGTTSVNVHDLAGIPPEGLWYSVFLPVDLTAYQRPCEQGAATPRVRAILSWQVAPPPGNPNYVPTWGNRDETVVQVKPGAVVGDARVPFLSRVGDMDESKIAADGKADGTTQNTGFLASDSPFGGRITMAGHISNPVPGLKYRVMRKPHGDPDSAYAPLTLEPQGLDLTLNTWDLMTGWHQTTITVHADGDGYYSFEDYAFFHSIENSTMMVWYSTAADDGLTFDLRIDLSVDGNPANDVHSNVVTVLIDNTAPTIDFDIDLGAGVDCADFDVGATFTGTYTATDEHFGRFSFEILPAGPAHGVLPSPPSGASVFYSGAITDPGVSGGTYTLHTAGMDACGYALILHVWDRTNVNSGAGSNYNHDAVGFCLKAV
jgi:hypothetical protein